MIFARIAVAGAILCTLWFNGSYAWHRATDLPSQIALVALALTVDMAKVGLLPAAANRWRHGHHYAAALLVVLFVPCLAFSIFAGYSSITTNRATTTVTTQATADARARAQTAYDQATADLGTAKLSPFWKDTAACTTPHNAKQRDFCDKVATDTLAQTKALAVLNEALVVAVDPELHTLADVTGWPQSRLLLTVALWPAVLLELVSSLGLYAVSQPTRPPRRAAPVARFRHRSSSSSPPPAPPVHSGAAIPAKPNGAAGPPRSSVPAVSWPKPPPVAT